MSTDYLLNLLSEAESAMAEICDCGKCTGCNLAQRIRTAIEKTVNLKEEDRS